jgi:hypothetical protein
VVASLAFLLRNRSFTLKKGLPTNPDVAPNAVLPERHKPDRTEAVTIAESARCIPPFVPLAGRKLRYLFNLLATNRYIAVNVSSLAAVKAGNRTPDEAFPG